jgi:hypothetical protein
MNANGRCALRIVALWVTLSGWMVVGCEGDNYKSEPNYTISGDASGSQLVPAVTGDGKGRISGTYNPNTRELKYINTWTGLTGGPIGGGFYSGASGENAIPVGNPWTFPTTAIGTGTHSGSMRLSEGDAEGLISGNWYFGYNTVANSSGEVRGQITAKR